MNWLEPGTLAKFAEIVLTDLVLAGDNALVIALATRTLPRRQRFWGQIFGAGGAVGLRVLFVFLITWLTRIPVLQLVAGLVLLWVAWKLVRPQNEAPVAAEEIARKAPSSVWHAVRLIIVADVVMSLDNVIAIAGIAKEGSDSPHGEMGLVIFGLLLSIPLVICGSALISKLMSRFRWVIWLGGGVLGHVAGKIIFQDPRVLGWLGVPAANGMPEAQIAVLLAAADGWVRAVVHGVPWLFAVTLFLLGARWGRDTRSENAAESPGKK